MKPDDYRDHQGKRYEWDGWTSGLDIEALPELKGRPWDENALALVHGLRPSWIRVIGPQQCMTCDAIGWRVTVRVDKDGKIKLITQQVEVALPKGIRNGEGLRAATHGW